MRYELVIFDLDGTVLDTLTDLSNAVNFALRKHGHPERTRDEVRRFVGNGVAKLIARSLPEAVSTEERSAVLRDFKARYREHMNDFTCPYPGIPALLAALRAGGRRVGINSNKFDAALQALCHLHFEGLCDIAMGESAEIPRKPDPTAALRMMEHFGIAPERTIYIGDSTVDLETARNAGCDAAWVGWGFRRREEMDELQGVSCFENVSELQQFLLDSSVAGEG